VANCREEPAVVWTLSFWNRRLSPRSISEHGKQSHEPFGRSPSAFGRIRTNVVPVPSGRAAERNVPWSRSGTPSWSPLTKCSNKEPYADPSPNHVERLDPARVARCYLKKLETLGVSESSRGDGRPTGFSARG
jgi:hypothetical protein